MSTENTDKLRSELDDLKTAVSNMSDYHKDLQATIGRLQENMTELSTQQAGLMQIISENEAANQDMHGEFVKNEELFAKATETHQAALKALREKIAQLEAKMSKMQELRVEIKDVEAEMAAAQQETTEMVGRLENVEEKEAEARMEKRIEKRPFRRAKSMASVAESRQRLAAVHARAGALALKLMAHVPRQAAPLSVGAEAGRHNPYIV